MVKRATGFENLIDCVDQIGIRAVVGIQIKGSFSGFVGCGHIGPHIGTSETIYGLFRVPHEGQDSEGVRLREGLGK